MYFSIFLAIMLITFSFKCDSGARTKKESIKKLTYKEKKAKEELDIEKEFKFNEVTEKDLLPLRPINNELVTLTKGVSELKSNQIKEIYNFFENNTKETLERRDSEVVTFFLYLLENKFKRSFEIILEILKIIKRKLSREEFKKYINRQNKNGWTLLHYAAESGEYTFVEEAIRLGANREIFAIENGKEITALELAKRKMLEFNHGLDTNTSHEETIKALEIDLEELGIEEIEDDTLLTKVLEKKEDKILAIEYPMIEEDNLNSSTEGNELFNDRKTIDELKLVNSDLNAKNDKIKMLDFYDESDIKINQKETIKALEIDLEKRGIEEIKDDIFYFVSEEDKVLALTDKKLDLDMNSARSDEDIQQIYKFVEMNPYRVLKKRDEYGRTFISALVWNGSKDSLKVAENILKILIENLSSEEVAEYLNTADKSGWTFLHYTSNMGAIELSELAIANGANRESLAYYEGRKVTPIELEEKDMIDFEKEETLKILPIEDELDEDDWIYAEEDFFVPLIDKKAKLDLFNDEKLSFNDEEDDFFDLVEEVRISNTKKEIASLKRDIVKEHGIKKSDTFEKYINSNYSSFISYRGGYGDTVLIWLSSRGYDDLVKYTLEVISSKMSRAKMEEYINMKDESGFNALHSSAMRGYSKVVEVLLRYGADQNALSAPYEIEDTEYSESSAFEIAKERHFENDEIEDYVVMDYSEVINILEVYSDKIEKNIEDIISGIFKDLERAEINRDYRRGYRVLEENISYIVKYAVEERGTTFLIELVSKGKYRYVSYILRELENFMEEDDFINYVNIQENSNGWTALHTSAAFGYDKITRELLEVGVDKEKQSYEGEKAIDLAKSEIYRNDKINKTSDNTYENTIEILNNHRTFDF